MDRINMTDLVEREVYRIRSRNLSVGVWVPDTKGFIGVREKFGSKYLFTEYHYDADPHYGTVSGMEPLGVRVPDEIELVEGTTRCSACKERVIWVKLAPDVPTATVGHWAHLGQGTCLDGKINAAYFSNGPLFDLLKPLDDAEWST